MDINDLLELQRQLQIDSFGYDPATMVGDERADFIRWNVLALEDELHEALAETGWKPWATSRHLNRDAFRGELVDALHFFLNLLIVAHISGDELGDGYLAKRKVNAQRQEDGYDGVTGKDPVTKRALDEPELDRRAEEAAGRDSVLHPATRMAAGGRREIWDTDRNAWVDYATWLDRRTRQEDS